MPNEKPKRVRIGFTGMLFDCCRCKSRATAWRDMKPYCQVCYKEKEQKIIKPKIDIKLYLKDWRKNNPDKLKGYQEKRKVK